jgi:hypothetical protein
MVTTILNSGVALRMKGYVNGARSVLSGSGWSTQKRPTNGAAARRWERGLQTFAQSAMVLLIAAVAGTAFAQSVGGDGASALCEVAKWLKTIATTAGLIALFLFVMNSFFAKSSIIGDIIMYVVIGCVVMTAGSFIIGKTGLTMTCTA